MFYFLSNFSLYIYKNLYKIYNIINIKNIKVISYNLKIIFQKIYTLLSFIKITILYLFIRKLIQFI